MRDSPSPRIQEYDFRFHPRLGFDNVDSVFPQRPVAPVIGSRSSPEQPLRTAIACESPKPWLGRAHEAGRCAEEQGKFWEYRDLLYKNAPAAGPEQLSDYALKTGMDVPAFKRCLDSGKFKMVVQKDETEGDRLGVQGTPAFFINGRLLSGAQPEDEFARVIDEELNKRAQK